MTVAGMIDNPQNSIEEEFFFPISFERVYTDFWYKFAVDNNLGWLPCFSAGTFVKIADFDKVRAELNLFKNFLLEGKDLYYLRERRYIITRIELFLEKLDIAEAMRNDIVLYIG